VIFDPAAITNPGDGEMIANAFGKCGRGEGILAASARAALLAALVMCGALFTPREALANAAMVAAANSANAGIVACASNSGKALYNCIANVLDKLSNDISSAPVQKTRSALQSAASQLRAAASKAQALSAISQCRALIAGALRQVRATGGKYVEGWGGGGAGGAGLEAISGVLSRAAALIQSKG
jgi:hypothetical protein